MSRNKGRYRMNCFLSVLVGLILTAIVIFVIVEPEEKDSYEISLSSFATFWPLKRRLSLHHRSLPKHSSLELLWGYHVPEMGSAVPSYCSKSGGSDCTTGNCCLRYPGHSRLHMSSFSYDSSNCVRLVWFKERVPDEIIYFIDCIFTRGRKWYGGLLQSLNVSWPISWETSSEFRCAFSRGNVLRDNRVATCITPSCP